MAPWLTVIDARKAVDWYKAAFDAVELSRLDGDGGTIEVAQLAIGDAAFWVQHDVEAVPSPGAGSIRLILSVDDPDSVFQQAVAAGATVVASIHEEYGWRTGRLTDPFGHDWEVSKQVTSG
jgi:PhnB protein